MQYIATCGPGHRKKTKLHRKLGCSVLPAVAIYGDILQCRSVKQKWGTPELTAGIHKSGPVEFLNGVAAALQSTI